MRKQTIAKAEELVAEGRVHYESTHTAANGVEIRYYTVDSKSGRKYNVRLDPYRESCDCRASSRCSHIEAVEQWQHRYGIHPIAGKVVNPTGEEEEDAETAGHSGTR